MTKPRRPHLHLVATTRAKINPAPRSSPPYDIDAMAFEEDTSLVLSADPKIRGSGEHPIRIMTALHDSKPFPVGTAIFRGARPYRFFAIVHDFDQEPSFQPGWVRDALRDLLAQCEEKSLGSLGLEPLGVLHGKLAMTEFKEMLANALAQTEGRYLKRIWLIEP